MHKRQLAMRAELYDIDKRDKAMAAREDAVEAKLSKAHYELKQAQRMQETTMGYETKFSALATCKSQVRTRSAVDAQAHRWDHSLECGTGAGAGS